MVKMFGLKAHSSRLKKMAGIDIVNAVGKAVYAASDIIKTEAQLSIVQGAIQGKGHVPSKPGEHPNADTRQLDTSIINAKTGELKAEVSSNAPYSAALEFGTSKMAERPFMRPAVQKHRKDAIALVRKAVDRVTRK